MVVQSADRHYHLDGYEQRLSWIPGRRPALLCPIRFKGDMDMGLFDFVKDAGEKLFNQGPDEAETNQLKADSIKGHVMGLGLEVQNLSVAFDDGIATIGGVVTSQADEERILLAVGNIYGVAQVNDQVEVQVPEPLPEPEPVAVLYTVKAGDTLGAIAKAHYGDYKKYPVIFEANKPMLKDPDRIYPGQVLRIPCRWTSRAAGMERVAGAADGRPWPSWARASPEEQVAHGDGRHDARRIGRQPAGHRVPGAPDLHRAEVHRQHVEGGLGRALHHRGQATGEAVGAVLGHGLDEQPAGAAARQGLHEGRGQPVDPARRGPRR